MNIRLLKQEEIERDRWNGCVHYAHNGNLFGYKWFLDQVAKDWDALVEDEYHSVFPLVYRNKNLNRRSLYQPALMREMGIYSVRALSSARIKAFLEAIPSEYKKIDIRVSRKNYFTGNGGYSFSRLSNHMLDLNPGYEDLSDQFSSFLFSKLDQAQTAGLLPLSGPKPEKLAKFIKQYRPEIDEFALMRVMYNLLHRGWGFASVVHDSDGNWLAVDFFAYSHGKAMSLAFTESPEGKALGAGAFLYNLFLRSHASRPLVLDFNTADSTFPDQFGASEVPFYRLEQDKRLFGIF